MMPDKRKNDQLSRLQIGAIAALGLASLLLIGMTLFGMTDDDSPAQPDMMPEPETLSSASEGNLLANTSFERDPSSASLWTMDERGTELVTAWSDDMARSGQYALMLRLSAGANRGWPGWFTTLPLDADTDYTFSAYAFSSDGAQAWLSATLLNAEGQRLTAFASGCLSVEEGWRELERPLPASLIADAGATQVQLGLQHCLSDDAGRSTTLYFDDVAWRATPR